MIACRIRGRTRDVDKRMSLKLNVTFVQKLGRSPATGDITSEQLFTVKPTRSCRAVATRRRLSVVKGTERLAGGRAGISARDNNSSGGMTRRHPVSKNAAARLARLYNAGKREISVIIATKKR